MSMNKKRDIGSYIPVTVSDSEDDSDSDVEGDLTSLPEQEAIRVNLFDKNAFEPTPQPPKKTKSKRRFTNVVRGQEPLQVFLRVRPIFNEELEAGEDQGCIEIADGHDILLTAPKTSNNYKNFLRGTSKASHKYTFSRIMEPDMKQKEFFEESTLQTVQDFVNGQNCLVFTYGVTNSGKTYTIQGTPTDPGILPRSLDVLFNSVEAQLDDSGRFQPNMFSSVIRLSDEDIARGAKEKKEVMLMSMDAEAAAANAANTTVNTTVNTTIAGENSVSSTNDSRLSQCDSDRGSLSSGANSSSRLPSMGTEELEMLPEINREIEDMSVDIQGQGNVKFSIWVSFAEIYNEFIYDLLDKIPTLSKGKKFIRRVLRLSDDPNGNVFIKGLKKICVKNADEAYRVMLAGQKNLHKAATKLNHNSSRSHCIFTVSLVRIVDAPSPKVARTSMLHLVDLAGSERQKKTGSEGDRLKESSNINTTLLTLGKCIQALKFNQNHPANKHQIVPFRESRLTRLFQTFFQGKGRAMMIVNVNQLASTFDETLHAIKFSAIAKEVVILTQPEPPPKEIKEKKIMGPPAPPLNKNNAVKGKTSIAAKPAAKPGAVSTDAGAKSGAGLSSNGAVSSSTTAANKNAKGGVKASMSAKETIDLNVTTSSEAADGSCRCKDVPSEYYTIEQGNHMKSMIETLKDNLKKKGRENREMEMRIRQEVTEEMAQQLVKIQDEADERVSEAQNQAEEMMEKRIELLQEGFAAQNDRQARKRRRGEEDDEKMTTSMKKRLEDQQHRVETLQTENSKLQFDLSTAKTQSKELKSRADQSSKMEKKLEAEVNKLKAQLKEKTTTDSEMIDNRELITSLQQQLEAQREKNKEISSDKDELKVIVDEAATAFMEKESDISKLQEKIDSLTSENSSFAKEEEKLKRLIGDLKNGSRQHEGELKHQAESDQTEIKRLTKDLKEAESRAKKAESATAESAKELDVTIRRLREAESAAAESTEKRDAARNRLEETEKEISSLKRDLGSLQSEKTSMDGRVGEELRKLRNDVSAKEEKAVRIREELVGKTSEADELRGKLLEESTKNEALTKELEAEKVKLESLSVDRRDLGAEKGAALKTVEDLKKKITAIEIENENMRVEKSEAIEEKEKLNCELDRLLSEDDERTNALKNELEIRLKEVNAKEEERVKAVAETEEAKSALNQKMKEVKENSEKIRLGQERIAELSAELAEAKLLHVDDEFAAGKAEARFTRVKEELKSTQERLNFKEIEVEKVKADSAKAKEDMEEAMKEVEKASRETKLKMERDVGELQDKLKRETDSLQQKRSEVADLQHQVESHEREVLTKTKEVEDQRQEIEKLKKAAEAERNSLCENYRKILEEQEFSMEAQDKLIKLRDETCEKLEAQLKDLEKKYEAAKSNEGLQKIVEDTKSELQSKSEQADKLGADLSREQKAVKELQSQADITKLETIRNNERISELEQLVDAKTSALEAVNREKTEQEGFISVLENQVMIIRNQLDTMTNSDNSGSDVRRLEAEVESLKAYKSACDKRMSDKEDDLVSARQELRIAETKNMEEIARLKEDKLKSEDKLFQFKKDRDEIVDELSVLIKKRDTKIKELEEKLKHRAGAPQSASKVIVRKKVKVSDAVEEDFLTASSDSDTNDAAPGRKRRSTEITSTSSGKTPDAKPAFVRPATEPKRRKTANSAAKPGVQSSSRANASETNVEDQDEISNSSPPAKPTRSNTADTEDEVFKENESAKKRAGRSTRQSSRKPTASASKAPLQESKDDNESEPSDDSEAVSKKEKIRPRRKLYTQPDEPIDVKVGSIDGDEQENWGFSPLMRKLERQAPVKTRTGRSTRNK